MTAGPMTAGPMTAAAAISSRSDPESLSPQAFIARMRETQKADAFAKAKAEVGALQGYNQYSRPKVSMTIPLRSNFLDPKVNNIPKSKTRSELL